MSFPIGRARASPVSALGSLAFVEIQPGVGIERVRLGERQGDVEARLGIPDSRQGGRAFYSSMIPALVVDYGDAGVVELVEIVYAGAPQHEVTLNGIQLTYRPLDEVRSELLAMGYSGRESDIGFDFADGLAIWSMGSVWLPDHDPSIAPDDERQIVEGVSIASPAYFGF